jgi:hypothetical protein
MSRSFDSGTSVTVAMTSRLIPPEIDPPVQLEPAKKRIRTRSFSGPPERISTWSS